MSFSPSTQPLFDERCRVMLLVRGLANNVIHRHQFAMRRRSTIVSPIFKKNAADIFDEEHSLQAKTGKTHAVC